MQADGEARLERTRRWTLPAVALGLAGLVARLVQEEVAPQWSGAVWVGLLAVFVGSVVVRGPTWQRWWLATMGVAVVLSAATILVIFAATI